MAPRRQTGPPETGPPLTGLDRTDADSLAEMVAHGCPLGLAARRLSIPQPRAHTLWARIVANLGDQAR